MPLKLFLAFSAIAISIAQNLNCPPDWYLDSKLKNCYKVITQTGGLTFDQGDTQCKSLGGQLASVHSADENELISTLANQATPNSGVQTLIGGQRTGPKPKNWKWSDGTKWDYSNWSPLNPDNHSNKQGCIQLFSTISGPNAPEWYRPQQWDDLDCAAVHPNAVCKKSAINPCPKDWSYTPNLKSCYKMINQTGGLSFEQGDKQCKALGAQLASVHSAEENAFIGQVSNTGTGQGGSQTLIGAQRAGPKPTDWKWSDGSKWDYTNWSTGNPDNAAGGGGQDCIQAFSSPFGPDPPAWYESQKWDDRNCVQFVNAVCKKPLPK